MLKRLLLPFIVTMVLTGRLVVHLLTFLRSVDLLLFSLSTVFSIVTWHGLLLECYWVSLLRLVCTELGPVPNELLTSAKDTLLCWIADIVTWRGSTWDRCDSALVTDRSGMFSRRVMSVVVRVPTMPRAL